MSLAPDPLLMKAALGAVLAGARYAETASATVVAHKGNPRDIVTTADMAVSRLLETGLAATGLPVVSEEAEAPPGELPAAFWVVDPIDGSVNFAQGLPMYAVSAGLVADRQFRLGAVCAPALNQLYLTLDHSRALLNGRPFLHRHAGLDEGLAAASFAASAGAAQYELLRAVNESGRGCLRTGSAALNICWAASNRLQAAFGFQARLWDVAGALAVARAAGCEIALQWAPGALTLDYCVGSREVVARWIGMAAGLGLWGDA
jgi:myo-inositol-1(or 4)-monophosphatase